ncbi:MAG TPA: hypothetical protein DEV87_00700 [Clostridiales bacterium]|nr:hypothetical protein [Clostridiales bacterium]
MSNTLGMLSETAKQFDYVLIPRSHTHVKNFVVADDPDVQAAKEEVKNGCHVFTVPVARKNSVNKRWFRKKGFNSRDERVFCRLCTVSR